MTNGIRLRYSKLGKLRWTSHRDTARMWERALRRTAVPVAYSQGFAPRPRLSFGLALPTGAESVAEYLDIELAEPGVGDRPGLADELSAALPDGIDVTGRWPLSPGQEALQQAVVACTWRIEIPAAPAEDLASAASRLLAADRVMLERSRKGATVVDDIRPAVVDIRVDAASVPALVCDLATRARGLRPSELLGALGFDPAGALVRRTNQWIERDGAWREPLPAGATDAPHALERAS
ncbi:MAG TPA: TIGR03936 family radical SAM-associated protein [Acidimicrobiales bacterium]|nr:TIGR03936 family radical SAM-associated protein [Acidimicrobiales bacterium]